MTLVITAKVNDGIAVASDSQRSKREWPSGEIVDRWYDAQKFFELGDGFPVGFAFWGLAKIGETPIKILMKDFVGKLKTRKAHPFDWGLSKKDYTLEEISLKVRTHFYEDHYLPAYSDPELRFPSLVIQTLGYSASSETPEVFSMKIEEESGACDGPFLHIKKEDEGIYLGGDEGEGGPKDICNRLLGRAAFDYAFSADMPLHRVASLAERLVAATIKNAQLGPHDSTAGGPVDVAVISKEEGFKWVRCKKQNKDT